jgi:hypothetical protein
VSSFLPQKFDLVKWSGIFAPNLPYRKKVVLKSEEKKSRSPKHTCKEDTPFKDSSRSKMLAKVFNIDMSFAIGPAD